METFLIRVKESQSESVFKMDSKEKTLEFVAKVIAKQHPGTIQSIHLADTASGTMTEYEAVLNGYQLELQAKA